MLHFISLLRVFQTIAILSVNLANTNIFRHYSYTQYSLYYPLINDYILFKYYFFHQATALMKPGALG